MTTESRLLQCGNLPAVPHQNASCVRRTLGMTCALCFMREGREWDRGGGDTSACMVRD